VYQEDLIVWSKVLITVNESGTARWGYYLIERGVEFDYLDVISGNASTRQGWL
jgi:hypothetical protein